MKTSLEPFFNLGLLTLAVLAPAMASTGCERQPAPSANAEVAAAGAAEPGNDLAPPTRGGAAAAPRPEPPSPDDPPAAGSPRPAMRIYRDPETGRFGAPPPGTEVPQSEAAVQAFSTQPGELREEPSPVAGGGIMVDLGGRFQAAVEATVDAEGQVSTQCDTAGRAAGARGEG